MAVLLAVKPGVISGIDVRHFIISGRIFEIAHKAYFEKLVLLSQIKLSCVIPNEAKRSEEPAYFKIN